MSVCAVVVALAVGCRGSDGTVQTEQQQPPVLPTPTASPAFPDGTQSLEVTRMVGVRLGPGEANKRIGTLAINTRVLWTRTEVAPGCQEPWVEVVPRGWICSEAVKPSTRPPLAVELPRLGRGEIVPGAYGKVTAPNSLVYQFERAGGTWRERRRTPVVGSLTVRRYGEVTIGGNAYWKIAATKNHYVLSRAITTHVVSPYMGSRLGDDTGWNVPIAFVWPRPGAQHARITAQPNGAAAVRHVSRRTLLPIVDPLLLAAVRSTVRSLVGGMASLETPETPEAILVGDAEWIAAGDLRVFRPAPPPPSLLPGERWIDVDLDTQILVAFEGNQAVYATMVATGGKDTPTETGLYRIWLKESETDMNGLSGEDQYSVATVPWAQFFSPVKGLALHAAYWHDRFGNPLSHGCVNLAPRDARHLYNWTDPQVAPGWTSATGVVESPGSLIRIRSSADPSPPFKGYARKVAEIRAMRAPRKHGH